MIDKIINNIKKFKLDEFHMWLFLIIICSIYLFIFLNDSNIIMNLKEENKYLNYQIEILQEEIENQKQENKCIGEELTSMYALNHKLNKSIVEDNADVKELIYTAAKVYGVDPYLCIAIARLETGNFTSDLYLNHNNLGGIKATETEFCNYETLYEGVNSFVTLIKFGYVDKGLDTPQKMEQKYCPGNGGWANKVTNLMKEEKNNNYEYYE